MKRFQRAALQWSATLAVGASLFQIGGCSPEGVLNFVGDINPCGAILFCDPIEFRFLTSGYQGPGLDSQIDPACTFPPFCANDPFVGSITGFNP